MQRAFVVAGFIFGAAFVVYAQDAVKPLWESVRVSIDDDGPPPSLKRELIPNIRIGDTLIRFNDTQFITIERKWNLEPGQSGDAGEFHQWVCLTGSDRKGNWVLWLEGGEIHGPHIGGFTLRRLEHRQILDRRCVRTTAQLAIPTGLRLGMSPERVRAILGTPGRSQRQISEWLYEREARFTTENFIGVEFGTDGVTGITVSELEVN